MHPAASTHPIERPRAIRTTAPICREHKNITAYGIYMQHTPDIADRNHVSHAKPSSTLSATFTYQVPQTPPLKPIGPSPNPRSPVTETDQLCSTADTDYACKKNNSLILSSSSHFSRPPFLSFSTRGAQVSSKSGDIAAVPVTALPPTARQPFRSPVFSFNLSMDAS